MIIAGFAVSLLVLIAIFGFWESGLLYFRLPAAKITLNGIDSDGSKIYSAGNGDYLLFLETENAERPVYAVTNDGKSVGTPASPVPSSYTKSVKTSGFVLCLQCPITLAGTDKFDSGAKISTAEDEINFHVSPDKVTVKF